ncbi:reverse transcriptase/maturase family protein [Castellaniella caeni]|uniref:reverse transcriptase/maturase family protein n=1 Tax=Castellaniella caeni TaxID=266123 RepID=UPI002155EA15|nr:reverse transcriptase/maturase family protein [Castellaniella caeni]
MNIALPLDCAMPVPAVHRFLRPFGTAKRVEQDNSGNRDNTSNSGSRCANFNNGLSNSNWNTSLRAAGGDWQTAVMQAAYHGTLVSLLHLLRQIPSWVRRTASSENRKPRRLAMGKKYKNLYDTITSMDNLRSAYRKTSRGKRKTRSYRNFTGHLNSRLRSVRRSLTTGSYRQGKARQFTIFEPKQRLISALPFRDRLVQHALCNVLEPIFDSVFLPQSYACRRGKGTHAAARDVQAELRRMQARGLPVWVLKTDFSKYFYSIPLDVLHREYRRKISCKPTLALLEKMIPAEGRGIPIGELVSQLSANLLGHVVDRWLVHEQGVTTFFRYMDDIVILGSDRAALARLRVDLEAFAHDELGLRFSHWSLQPISRGINFVGYRIWPRFKLLRRDSVARAKRKVRRYRARGAVERLRMFLASWLGHAKWADSHHLIASMGVA